MRSLLGFLFIYLLVKTFLIALGVGIGFLLHWIVPAIDVGMGVLIGVVATGFSIYILRAHLRTARLIHRGRPGVGNSIACHIHHRSDPASSTAAQGQAETNMIPGYRARRKGGYGRIS